MRERRRVVLPEPRKPVRIVIGIGEFMVKRVRLVRDMKMREVGGVDD